MYSYEPHSELCMIYTIPEAIPWLKIHNNGILAEPSTPQQSKPYTQSLCSTQTPLGIIESVFKEAD